MAYDDTRLWTVDVTVGAMQTANTDDLLFVLPAGHTGRLVDVTVFLTTAVTTAAAVFTLGTEADDTTYGSFSVPIAAINTSPSVTVTVGTDVVADDTLWLGHAGDAAAGAGVVSMTFEVSK